MTDLDLALWHLNACAACGKPCAALRDELRRLYQAVAEPVPALLAGYYPLSESNGSQLDGERAIYEVPTHA